MFRTFVASRATNCIGCGGFPLAGDGVFFLPFFHLFLFSLMVFVSLFRAASEPPFPPRSFCAHVGFREPVCASTPKFFIRAFQMCFFLIGTVYLVVYGLAFGLSFPGFCQKVGAL